LTAFLGMCQGQRNEIQDYFIVDLSNGQVCICGLECHPHLEVTMVYLHYLQV